MSDDNIPQDFADVLGRLNYVMSQGTTISGRVKQLKTILAASLERLRKINENTTSIDDLVKRLKSRLNELEQMNNDLQSRLASNEANFQEQMRELQERQSTELKQANEQFEAEKAALAAERAALESSFSEKSDLSDREKQAALENAQKTLEEAKQASEAQIKGILESQQQEREKLVQKYQAEYNSLIRTLTNIADNQKNIIDQIGQELTEPEELTNEFSNVQTQIESLLAGISTLLNDTSSPVQSSSLNSAFPPPPPPQGEFPLSPAPQDQLPLQPRSDVPENLVPPNINFDEIERTPSAEIPESIGDPPLDNKKELFEYMLRVLAFRFKSGQMSGSEPRMYQQLKNVLSSWSRKYNSGDSIENLNKMKTQAYQQTSKFFNDTARIPPNQNTKAFLSGGRRTRRRKRVHFKTRSKRGTKSGKKGGRRGRKTHKVGKRRSGIKHTRKH